MTVLVGSWGVQNNRSRSRFLHVRYECCLDFLSKSFTVVESEHVKSGVGLDWICQLAIVGALGWIRFVLLFYEACGSVVLDLWFRVVALG